MPILYLNYAYKIASLSVETFALLVTGLLLFCCAITRTKGDRRGRIFMGMLFTNAAALFCDLITWLVEGAAYTVLIYLANFFVFSLGYVMTLLFTAYLACFVDCSGRFCRNMLRAIYFNCFVAVALVVLSLFNGMYFYVEDGVLAGGQFGWFSVYYSLVIIVMDMVLVWDCRRELGKRNTVVLLSYSVFPIFAFLIQMTGTELTLTWLASTLTMLLIYLVIHIDYVQQLKQRELELTKSRLELSESRTALVLSQIQPHFLYNVLNSIYYLCGSSPQKAQQVVEDFSDYLRLNLASLTLRELVLFETELRHVEKYISLEQVRYDEKLTVVYDIQTRNFRLPALTVQPLVENAVKHGLQSKQEGGTVFLTAAEREDCYEITVRDDGVGFDSKTPPNDGRVHVGIESVRSRLNIMCGGTLEINSAPGQGTTAVIRLPREGEAWRKDFFDRPGSGTAET